MATIRAAPRSRSASQVVPIYEDPVEAATVPVHDIVLDDDGDMVLDNGGDSALAPAIRQHEAPDPHQVQNAIREFEELASPEHDAALAAEYDEAEFAHDRLELDNEEEFDDEDELNDDQDDDDEDEDPFETSDLTEDGLDVRHSIEHDTPFRHERFGGRLASIRNDSKHSYDRSSSTTTAIKLDDATGLVGEEENKSLRHYSGDARQASDTWSSLPEELPEEPPVYYKSPLPGRNMLNHHNRSPLSASRSHLASPPSPSPLANRERLLSSPTRAGDSYVTTPTRQKHLSSQQMRDSDQHQHPSSGSRQAFRNPSSVIRMQMSSPPPFSPGSPRSARHKRGLSGVTAHSRQGSPFAPSHRGSRPGTPSRHANPNKEYPLVLLHCTLSPLPSTFAFSPAVLEKTLLPNKLRDVALLKERLGSGGTTVLERGVLIPHPGDDYELLEERILESLELRRPRVGGCGHFNSGADIDSPPSYHSNGSSEHGQDDADCKCADCGQHVDHALLHGEQAERRWDVRVYAANGLMRSGAWSAAWREMEKVDVEVGVYLSDQVRQSLERASREDEDREEERLRESHLTSQRQDYFSEAPQASAPMPMPMPSPQMPVVTPMDMQRTREQPAFESPRPQSHDGSGPRANVRASTVQFNRGRKQKRQHQAVQLPLQTLLWNYLVRVGYEKRGLLAALAILVAGLCLAATTSRDPISSNMVLAEPLLQVETSTSVYITTATEVVESIVTATATVSSAAAVETEVQTATSTETLTATETMVASATVTATETLTATETTTATETRMATETTTATADKVETALVTTTVTVTETQHADVAATPVGLETCISAHDVGDQNGTAAPPAPLATFSFDTVLSQPTSSASRSVFEGDLDTGSDPAIEQDLDIDVGSDTATGQKLADGGDFAALSDE